MPPTVRIDCRFSLLAKISCIFYGFVCMCYMCMYVFAYAYTDARVRVCVCRPDVRCHPQSLSTISFETLNLELTDLVRLAVQLAPRIHLSLPTQCWDYRCAQLCLSFMWIWGPELKASGLLTRTSSPKPSP